MEIPVESIRTIDIDKRYSDISRDLGKIKDDPVKSIIIKAKGFEKYFKEIPTEESCRKAHDFAQNVIEDDKINTKEKIIVVFPHIGYSLGKQGYDEAVSSVAKTRFARLIEID